MTDKTVKKVKKKKAKRVESLMTVVKRKMKKFDREIKAEGRKRATELDVHVIIREVDKNASEGAPSSDKFHQEGS